MVPGKILQQHGRNSRYYGGFYPQGRNITDHQTASCQLPGNRLDQIRPEGQQGGQGPLGRFEIDRKGIGLDKTHIAAETVPAEISRQRRAKEPLRHGGENLEKSPLVNIPQGFHYRQAAGGMAKAMGRDKKGVLHCLTGNLRPDLYFYPPISSPPFNGVVGSDGILGPHANGFHGVEFDSLGYQVALNDVGPK